MAQRLKSSIWVLLMAALPRLYATALAYADGSYGYVDAGHIDW